MSTIKSVLIVEDNRGDARLLQEMLIEEGLDNADVTYVGRMSDAEEHLAAHPADIILLDLGLPDAQGLDALRRAHEAAPRVPLVVLTGLDDATTAMEALRGGAEDYLVKGQIEARGLLRSLRYAVERKRLEDELLKEKELAQATLNCIADALACTDTSGRITFMNHVAEAMTGWSFPEAIGRPLTEVFRILDAKTRAAVANPGDIELKHSDDPFLSSDFLLVRRDSGEIQIENSIAPILDRDGTATGAVIIFRDVTAAHAMTQEMTYSAQHDFLTGLPNRGLLSDRIGQAIAFAARHQAQVAVLFLDLDGFKHINDSLGHPIGDKLLRSIAGRLENCVRAADTVSRQGGDEFIVLLSEVQQPEGSANACNRILQAVAEAHSIDTHDLHVTASIGVSVYPHDGQDAETLIKNADTAMYQAKENGRQNYQFFAPAMNVRAVERQSTEESLRRALDRQEFSLHYQPKINLRTGAITGAEALIRWEHPTRGAISPAQFIPVAEECGLILPIGSWVLREACAQARTWTNAGLPETTMAVNVSAMQFRNEGFLDGVLEILSDTGMDPRFLELELTESVLMRRIESTAFILQKLRESGVRVAVDDFGTGYSSLSYLHKFPVDALKIDQSFVRQIDATGEAAPIVGAIIGMAQSLKLRVVAEGVETLEELAFLRAHQCDEAQGYYFSRPVVPNQFAGLLRTGVAAEAWCVPAAETSEAVASQFLPAT